jgi:hypothetical protein
MDKILNFVALRPPSQVIPSAPTLASSSDFQQVLTAAVAGPHPLEDAVAEAQLFVEGGRFLVRADEVNHGVEFLALYERLADASPRNVADIEADVREVVGDSQPTDWAEDATRARDSILAGYLLEGSGPSAAIALTLVRVYSMIEAVLAGDASQARLDTLLRAPLILPDYLLGLHERTVTDTAPPSPDAAATALVEQFQSVQVWHSRLSDTLAHIMSHDEDELVLSELGEHRPLASLYRTALAAVDDQRTDAEREIQKKPLDVGEFVGSSLLRRAASRSNVIFSDRAVRLLSDPARETLHSLGLDPSVDTVQEMQSRVMSEHGQVTQTLRTLSLKLGDYDYVPEVDDTTKHLIAGVLGQWKVDPVNDPSSSEPVATAPPVSFSKVKPLGIADLYLVRTHISRYERGEVASLENILAGEKLTHTLRQLNEVETTDTIDSEQISLQSLAQTTAEQNSGKTTVQAVGAGRGPLTSDGPESFSKAVTDQVSSSSSNRNRKASVLRQLLRNEESMEHILENTTGTDVRFGVYQWLDKVYQAQVFNYGTPRLLYDIVIPEPAALFREALSRPRGQSALPPRPAKFTVPVDKLSLFNWSYYATGHQATGVDAPPQSQVIVTEPFGRQAPDPFSTELNANTLEIGETRITRIPKGYKATKYRLVAEASGYTPFILRAIIGSKTVAIDGTWDGQVFSGKLDGEVESLPVGLIADGNGVNPSISTLSIGIEIICEPTDEAISAWQTKAHGLILAANQRRITDYEERVANRDATARLQLQSLSTDRKAAIIQSELKRTTLAVLTNQNFSEFNANRVDSLGFPYPDAAATTALSAYIRFFEQAVEWEHIECAFFPYFWGSRSSWVSKILNSETNPIFSSFLSSGAARVVLPIRPGYEVAFEHFLNTGKTPTTDELLDVGGPLWVSLVSQMRHQGAEDRSEVAVGDPWEFRLASDLVRARRDGLLPKWTLNAGSWVEEADPNS